MNIWHEIKSLLEQGCSLYLLTVVESKGSAPGRRGFKMLVVDNDYLYGSIGGGIMEFNMVEKAKQLLGTNTIAQHVFQQDHHGNSKSSSGMICSGSQTIGFNYLTKDDLMLVSACYQTSMMIEFSNKGIKSIDLDSELYFRHDFSDVWCYSELIHQSKKQSVHLFGAGHVSLPTSKVLTDLGYEIILYDNRKGINTFEQNLYVVRKQVVDYHDVMKYVDIKAGDCVLLMTHKFTEDKLLLTQLLSLNLSYLGVLGSANKIEVMFNHLLSDGYKQEQLDQVFAPIGLDISSQTPEEIAISIAAEMIKNEKI